MSQRYESVASPAMGIANEEGEVRKVLRNTFMLLGMLLAFSTITAWYAMVNDLPRPNVWLILIGFYGLFFAINMTKNSGLGLVFAFALTGFMGYTLGPVLNAYVAAGAESAITLSLGMTAVTFVGLAGFVLVTKKDFSGLSGFLAAGGLVLIVAMIANIFFQIPALHMALSACIAVFASACILFEVSRIVNGGERNYVMAAVGLFVSIYNLFISLLSLIGMGSSD